MVRFTRVALCLCERLVAKYSHDLVRSASRVGKTAASSFAKAMRLTIEREPGASDRIPHPLAEAINRERLAVLCVDDGYMVVFSRRHNREQVAVERNHQLSPGLLLHDANCPIAYVSPGHAVHVAPALARMEHQRKRKPLLCADRPMLFKCRNFGLGPRADFLRLWSFDAERWIMVKPSNVDGMPDQHAQNFEDRKRGAWPVSIGLQDAGRDPLTCQANNRALWPCFVLSVSMGEEYATRVVSRRPRYAELRI